MKSRTEIVDQLRKRVLVIDGAMGTQIQALQLSAADFGGEDLEGCNEYLNLTRPEIIQGIHEAYLEAGADIIETNSFGGTALVLAEYGLQKLTREINYAAAHIARLAADKYSSINKPRFVAGSMGPTTKSICVTGGLSFDELVDYYKAQAEALIEGGVDFLLLETCQDTLNVKAGLIGIEEAQKRFNIHIPVAVSGTIETTGTLLAGQGVEAFYTSLSHKNLLYLGLNCATGPSFMTDHIRSLSEISKYPLACVPNAGLPDEDGNYLESPEMMSQILEAFCQRAWINLIGGCCGTTPEHIRLFSKLAAKYEARKPATKARSLLSGIDFLEVEESLRPGLVGERTNVIGSRKFKSLIQEEKWEEASEIGRAQIKGGAHILDICLADPDRNEKADMNQFLEVLSKKITAPLMIDSTDPEVIETALKWCQGKALINSINLEDGELRFEQVCPLVHKYGAAVVVGCIDDDPQQGMAISRERKLEVAKRSYKILTEKYGIQPEDIYWDALVFPCATGDAQYIGSAVETIEGVRAIKEHFPDSKTILGISNVSFGLPPRGREVLNSVFLYHCVQAGLDLAIVNTEKLERYAQIPDHERELCENLLWMKGDDPIGSFTEYFREQKVKNSSVKTNLSLEERLAQYIIEGTKEGLIEDLEEARKKYSALEIINGPLMKGMDEVGRLFGQNKLIVAEVLQSAESMKTAVAHLQQYMEKQSSSLRGRLILATVKGDVHDIGKNLVDIIFSNNGFEVINLGIKVPPQEIIRAVREYSPQFIGLSGLLVKSAQQMVVTAQDLANEGIQLPILVGGAALTQNFTDKRIAPAYGNGFVEYARDAMSGLELAKRIADEKKFEELKSKSQSRRIELMKSSAPTSNKETPSQKAPKSNIKPQENPPRIKDLERHLIQPSIHEVWPYINPLMLLGRHLGVKGSHVRAFQSPEKFRELKDEPEFKKSLQVLESLETLKKEVQEWMKVRAVYQFFPAYSEADEICIQLKDSEELRWKFRRQNKAPFLCLSDYLNEEPGKDHLALFVTTAYGPVREKAEDLKNAGRYLESHMLMALALETAEAAAEYVHALIRRQWGFPDSPEMSMMDRFQARYRGRRYSFGYPACPDLDYQETLFKVLRPEDIGVELTDGYMMFPEWSVSAIVFSHPEATYFGVKYQDE